MKLIKNSDDIKAKLLKLDLSGPLVEEILDIFETYLLSREAYSKPKGIMAFNDNLDEIKSLSKRLSKKLEKLTNFERQMLSYPKLVQGGIRSLKQDLVSLSQMCEISKNKDIKFSKKEPLLRQLTIELWELLERYEISVTLYRGNILCRILDVLLKVEPDSEKSFNLVREISKRRQQTRF
ncbi:MAG: hypothetical protein B1H11_04690 [Desulfobacteraceae bacterium 4484_190.1]|nr:hypothetical protein [Deltaproteobacteria bacterium]OPX38331.1 MAG: hypothetical protein B1H11_04690 [Desulfobacteraceae bacterium 4484_190.1]